MIDMSRPAIFYAPHADDETLNAGITIAEHVAAGRPTHVVLMTHGRVTGALDMINGVTLSGYWKIMHDPSLEGYSTLTKADLEQARIREFHNACAQLGVPASNRHIEYLDDPSSPGGESMTKAEAKAVIQNYIAAYPDADHFTMSYHDVHPDHAACGEALIELYNDGEIEYNVRFLISMQTRNTYESNGQTPPGWKDTPTNSTITNRLTNACRCYAAWSPTVGSYAVGYHSVFGQFDKLLTDPFHYIHLPNA